MYSYIAQYSTLFGCTSCPPCQLSAASRLYLSFMQFGRTLVFCPCCWRPSRLTCLLFCLRCLSASAYFGSSRLFRRAYLSRLVFWLSVSSSGCVALDWVAHTLLTCAAPCLRGLHLRKCAGFPNRASVPASSVQSSPPLLWLSPPASCVLCSCPSVPLPSPLCVLRALL